MGRQRQPIELLEQRGKKHLTKDEIKTRTESEVQPCTDDIKPPSYLTDRQKTRFRKLAGQLVKIKIFGETDVETLARYVVAELAYESYTAQISRMTGQEPKEEDYADTADYNQAMAAHLEHLVVAAQLQDRYFKQAHAVAQVLGMTISSRCKLEVPQMPEDKPKKNRFAEFDLSADRDGDEK